MVLSGSAGNASKQLPGSMYSGTGPGAELASGVGCRVHHRWVGKTESSFSNYWLRSEIQPERLSNDEQYWLAPDSLKNEILSAPGQNVLFYKPGFSMTASDPTCPFLSLKDPVIHIPADWSWGKTGVSGGNIYFAAADHLEDLAEGYQKLGLENLWASTGPMTAYEKGVQKSQLICEILVVLLECIVIFLFEMQSIQQYFRENSRKIGIMTMAGKPVWEKYGTCFLAQVAGWAAALCICLFYLKDLPGFSHREFMHPDFVPDYSSLILGSFGIIACFGLLFSALTIRRFEKHQVLAAMKGETE